MIDSRYITVKLHTLRRHLGESGVSAVEMALILPLMLMMLFAIIDFGRVIQARLVLTNVAREGGSLGSRDIQSATDLITMLQNGASPLDLATSGKIYIWKIRAGATKDAPYPAIDLQVSKNGGVLSVQSSIGSNVANLGLSTDLYKHLVFDSSAGKNTADISEATVVEVFYKYTPITPILSMLNPGSNEMILSSKAEF